ncbi:MAG: hypothetical protein O3C05_02455, partial [Proteobacteria bacterium]|nr:hypothetical protein [Pseudomonadota bacterium]
MHSLTLTQGKNINLKDLKNYIKKNNPDYRINSTLLLDISNYIMQDSMIESVQVKFNLPSKIEIIAKERYPEALQLMRHNTLNLIDKK